MFMHIIFKYKLNFVLRDINMSNHGEPFHSGVTFNIVTPTSVRALSM
jgi:hypothetical protein